MPITERMRELILEGASRAELQKEASSTGVLNMRESGLEKVLEGITTIEEILGATKAD